MSGADQPSTNGDQDPVDEFDWIDRCLRPLAADAPEAFGLLDDAAAIPARPGFDLIVSKDAIVEGVHFLPSDPLDRVARKLLRTNLSDLAAKGAEPYGYFLAIAWPFSNSGWERRRAFAAGLAADQADLGLKLLGGDTVSTPGPLTASATILGWSPQGRMVRRSGARPGDLVLVTGSIGDGALGLRAARGEEVGVTEAESTWLRDRYQLPQPRLGLGEALRAHASAAADVSDGLIADAGRIAEASGMRLTIDLARMPLSLAASHWLALQADPGEARAALAVGGDDYEILCTASAEAAPGLCAAAEALGMPMTEVGFVSAGQGAWVLADGHPIRVQRAGWRHGG
jgi:thiamine-monophosphate kinase